MLVKHDYSYITDGKELIEKGYAELDIHSLNFDRYFTEEEKENNRRLSYSITREEWNMHCDEVSEQICNKMLPIVELLNNKYDIHQITEEKSSMEHYRSNWDLYFYSNKGWNGKNYFDYVQITFNKKRIVEQNKKLLEEILILLDELQIENVYCRVQYTTRRNEEKIKEKTIEICENLLDKTIEYNGMKGKIKVIEEHENEKTYGFFKSRARNHYYKISDTYLILNYVA
jgi:hypothetical protein